MRSTHRLSIFSQSIDRVAFVAYFLGCVVPLAGLAFVAHRYMLPGLSTDGATATVGVLAGVGCLSLGSFLALRRVARQTVGRLDTDRRRLETMLDLATRLADARFADDVNRTVADTARKMCSAEASTILTRKEGDEDGTLDLASSAGDDAMTLYTGLSAEPVDALSRVAAQGVPALLNEDGLSLAAVPLAGDATRGVLAVFSRDGSRFDGSHLRALSTMAAFASVARHGAGLRDAQRNFFVHVTEILIAALDQHLDQQIGHSRRVAQYAMVTGRAMELEEGRLERLHFAALLHDIGMLKIDRRRFGDKESHRQHPGLGARMLSRIKVWEDLATMILHHHEWWDGSGYPEGLAENEIPLESRIIALAEAFDSMTSASSYREPRSFDDALAQVEACAGTQFDPRVAQVFLDLAGEGVIPRPQE